MIATLLEQREKSEDLIAESSQSSWTYLRSFGILDRKARDIPLGQSLAEVYC
jgi:hypothetical protein